MTTRPVLGRPAPGAGHLEVTGSPTAAWLRRQPIAATPWGRTPRCLVRDRDAVYGAWSAGPRGAAGRRTPGRSAWGLFRAHEPHTKPHIQHPGPHTTRRDWTGLRGRFEFGAWRVERGCGDIS